MPDPTRSPDNFTVGANEWERMVTSGEIEDISDKLQDAFLMVGMVMRALVRYRGKIYYATGWVTGGAPFVRMMEQETISRRMFKGGQ